MGKVKTIKRKTVVREKATTIAFMLNAARQEINNNGYSVFGGTKSALIKVCPKCGRLSLVGCISKDKEFIISLCFFRYHKQPEQRCIYNKKWPNRKVEEDKAKADAAPNKEV